MISVLAASARNNVVLVDGTDEVEEGNWTCTTTNETPMLTTQLQSDRVRNCLMIGTAFRIWHTMCNDTTASRRIFCEYEGSSDRFNIL